MNGIGSLIIDDYMIGVGSFYSINRWMRGSIEANYKRKLRGFIFTFAKLNELEQERERYNQIFTYLLQRRDNRFDFSCKITKPDMVLTGRVLFFNFSPPWKSKTFPSKLIFAYKKLERVVNGTND